MYTHIHVNILSIYVGLCTDSHLGALWEAQRGRIRDRDRGKQICLRIHICLRKHICLRILLIYTCTQNKFFLVYVHWHSTGSSVSRMWGCPCVCVYIYACMHACMHTHTDTQTHIHVHKLQHKAILCNVYYRKPQRLGLTNVGIHRVAECCIVLQCCNVLQCT